jgi:hypothetical protein
MSCDDGDPCTENTRCHAGRCVGDFVDGDGDGQAPSSCGGPDCDDGDPSVYSSGSERGASCNDQTDNDCDGDTDAADYGCSTQAADTCTSDGFCWEDPLPQGETLLSIWGTGPDDVWFAGGRSIVHFDGARFALHDHGIAGASFTAVHGTAANDVWFAGGNVLLHYDGITFENRTADIFDGTNETSEADVWAVSPTDVWVHHRFDASHYDGTAWRTIAVGTASSNSSRLWGSPEGTVYFVGTDSDGINLYSMSADTMGSADKEVIPFDFYPQAIGGTGDGDIWVAGPVQTAQSLHRGRLVRRQSGSWTEVAAFGDPIDLLWAFSSDDVWLGASDRLLHHAGDGFQDVQPASTRLHDLWGSGPGDLWAVGDHGSIQHYDGSRWRELSVRMPSTCEDVWGAAADNIYCVGQNGLVARRDATSWSVLDSGTTAALTSVWAAGSEVWVAGTEGTVLHGVGSSLSPVTFPSASNVLDVNGSAIDDVWAATSGRGLFRYDGIAWTEVEPDSDGFTTITHAVWPTGASPAAWRVLEQANGSRHIIESCTSTCSTSETVDNRLYDIWGFGPQYWAVGDGGTGLARVVNGPAGDSSISFDVERLYGVSGSTENDVWVVGSGLLAHWDGVEWTEVPGVPQSSRMLWTDGTVITIVGGGIVRYTP